MTPQEIFDTAVNHLRRQGEKSRDVFHNCKYRGPNGLMCALGPLIPDDKYDPKMEGSGVEDLIKNNLLPEELIEHKDLLAGLQDTHDTYCVEEWEEAFFAIAADFLPPLVYTPPPAEPEE